MDDDDSRRQREARDGAGFWIFRSVTHFCCVTAVVIIIMMLFSLADNHDSRLSTTDEEPLSGAPRAGSAPTPRAVSAPTPRAVSAPSIDLPEGCTITGNTTSCVRRGNGTLTTTSTHN